jgi:hypothetical protein
MRTKRGETSFFVFFFFFFFSFFGTTTTSKGSTDESQRPLCPQMTAPRQIKLGVALALN